MIFLIFYRAQVNELWSRGDRVTCGVISEDTRVSYICLYEPPAKPHSTDDTKLKVTQNGIKYYTVGHEIKSLYSHMLF